MRALNWAKRLAGLSTRNFKHAAVVFQGGAVIAAASNAGPYHAEVAAVDEAMWRSQKGNFTVLSIRLTNAGNLRCARPCSACMVYMRVNRVKTVLYSTDEGKIERMRL